MNSALAIAPSLADQATEDLRAELERMSAQLARIKEQLRATQCLTSLGTAAAMLAHEYNNQMTPVVGYARSAVDSNDVEFMRKALNLTLKHCATVTAMSERILGLAGGAGGAFGNVGLRAALDEAIACLGRELNKDGIIAELQVPPNLHVWADARQLQQVFFNLLINARQAMTPGGGRLSVKAEPADPDQVRIELRDTGCGIAEADLPHIFDPFMSTKTSETKGGRRGHGLGLTICKDIITDHHGLLKVSSRKGVGTTFTIMLPASEPSATAKDCVTMPLRSMDALALPVRGSA
ncbi:MAG TPA: ATP-binding protein [Phycisphaerae bacterium]